MRAAFAVMVACAAHVTAWAQAPGGAVEVNGWTVADQRDAAGRYVGCAAMVLFGGEVAFGFALDRGEKAVFVVQGPKANLMTDRSYPVRFKADDSETLMTGGVTLDDWMLIVPLQEPQKVFQEIRKASTLSVEVDQKAYTERLVGSAEVVEVLLACARRGAG